VKKVLEAQHVLPVVLEGRLEGGAPAASQVVEVGLRDQMAGDVVLPFEAEQPLLDGPQAAALQPRPEQAPAQVEQVQVGSLGHLARHPRHQPAGAEEGQVEGAAVVGGQAGAESELGVEGRQEGGLVRRLGEKELHQLDPVRMRTRHGGGEDLGAGATGQPGGLGVEEAEVVHRQPAQLGAGLGPAEAADRQHLGPAPGDAVAVIDRFEAPWRAAPGWFYPPAPSPGCARYSPSGAGGETCAQYPRGGAGGETSVAA
jgi:hypothetical protein